MLHVLQILKKLIIQLNTLQTLIKKRNGHNKIINQVKKALLKDNLFSAF